MKNNSLIKSSFSRRFYATLFGLLSVFSASAQVELCFDVNNRGAKIGDLHYGIFLEEINHAGDGGLYAELISNRSFEDDAYAGKWYSSGETQISIVDADATTLLNNVQRQALRVDFCTNGFVRNEGFWGMRFVKGEQYKLSLWVKSDVATSQTLSARLIDSKGNIVGYENLPLNLNAGKWTKLSAQIEASADCEYGEFELCSSQASTLYFDVVSLFPPTFKDRENGCRRDLAQMLADMKPAFMRFPGGCYVEGEWRDSHPHYDQASQQWTWGSPNRFEWKQTVGNIEDRPGHWNVNWNYRVSDGLGFHEMLQLSEDIGAEPLFVVNVGMGHGWCHPYDDIDEYIQEALDALEYCNGDASTTFGAMRIANGHPEPFNLRLIEIGNENYNYTSFDNRDQSDHYAERYIQFYNAIKAKYPDCVCIGNVESWSTDNPSWRNSHPVDAVDEHYYRSPSWFAATYNKYDGYDRATSPKVYAGEYAVTQQYGTTGNLDAALGEAIYMQGMENNSDLCIMASYAPIFVNENDPKWMPDMIRFDQTQSYGTPSYYVQKLMSNYIGTQNVKWTESGNKFTAVKEMYSGLSTWNTSAKFENLTITRADGAKYIADYDNLQQWTNFGGSWSMNTSGVLTQYDETMQGKLYLNSTFELGNDYVIELDATKKSGAEGFLIAFNWTDPDNYLWWNLGGWNNTKSAVEKCVNGVKSNCAERSIRLVTGNTYHLKIEVMGSLVVCSMDGEEVHRFTLPATDNRVYVSSSIDDDANKLYVKLVNYQGEASDVKVRLNGKFMTGGKAIILSAESNKAENTHDNPYAVAPQEKELWVGPLSFDYHVAPYSLNVLVIDLDEEEPEQRAREGLYYLYAPEENLYLDRGSNWGTRATLGRFGVPLEFISLPNGNFNLRYADTPSVYFGADKDPYTDKNQNFPIEWEVQFVDGTRFVLYNSGVNKWLGGFGSSFTENSDEATVFCQVPLSEYKDYWKESFEPVPSFLDDCYTTDVTDLLVNASMESGTSGWSWEFSKGGATRVRVNEVYEGYGRIYQTVTGLPEGWYRFSMPAFYRASTNETCAMLHNEGYTIGNAIIFANGSEKRLATWASDRLADYYPNSMEDASAMFDDGRYQNEVLGYVDESGTLTVGISLPQNNRYGWLIWGGASLTRLINPVDYTPNIQNSSFESGLTSWEYWNMQTQTNNEPAAGKTGNRYCEKWVQVPGTISSSMVQQTVAGLPDGHYLLQAFCHAEMQGNVNAEISGVWLFAGQDRVAVSKPGVYKVVTTVSGGELNIGFMAESSTANWITVDNFQLFKLDDDGGTDRFLLDLAIEQLEELILIKPVITDAMCQAAADLIAEAQAASDNEVSDYIDALKAMYESYKLFRLDIERNEPYVKYLFAYFPNNYDENLYFAVSDDGFSYTPLNNGQRVMASDTVAIKGGIRDPHLMRGEDGKTFYMVATDMRCAEGWASNRGLVMFRSTDLVNWSHSTVHFPDRFPEWAGVTRVWAPETIWDPAYDNGNGTRGRYMVYYSLLTNDGLCPYDKVFYTYANDDFTDFVSEPEHLYDRGASTIDADIVYDECDGFYHMVYKNEGDGGICSVISTHLTAAPDEEPGAQWFGRTGGLQQVNVAVEGGGLFRLINTNTWVLMYDCYTSGYYQFCSTTDWANFSVEANTTMQGAFTPRHGSVIAITAEEYNALLDAFPTYGLDKLPVDDPTAIEDLASGNDDARYYTLDGRQLKHNSANGMHLIKQNKVVIF